MANKTAKNGSEAAGYLFLLPWFIGLVVITAGPMLASFYLAFTDYNLFEAPEWTGLANIERMWTDTRLRSALLVTFRYVFISVPLQLALALLVALALNRAIRGLSFYRSAFYLPSLLGSSVAVALLWQQVFGQSGIVNQALSLIGIQGPIWISNPGTALWTLIVLNVWTFGAPMVIFLAGLRQIPRMYYEAAEVDGAGRFNQFIHVTVPLLTPIIFFNFVLQLINAFQTFTKAFVVSGGTGGPIDSTLFYTLYLYQVGFTQFEMGYASALAWLLLLITAAFTAINFVLSKFWVSYDQ